MLTEMTCRQRLINQTLHRTCDRGLRWPERHWNETWQRWLAEGMTEGDAGWYDFSEDEAFCLGITIGYCPPFAYEVLEEDGASQVVRDDYGIIKRVPKDRSGMPQFLSFPVHDRASWEALWPRLAADVPARYPGDWAARLPRLRDGAAPVYFGGTHLCGFFSFLRELCGDDVYYLFYDDPELLHAMLDFQADRLIAMLAAIPAEAPVDAAFIWEDMCYKNGPLIGPELFRDFLLAPYQRYTAAIKARGIPIIDVDSDGNVSELLPLWLEAGVNSLHPMEVAAGMDVVAVKRQYGERLSLHGGVDKRALARGRAAIDQELARIRPAYEQGGYIPHVDHAVPPDVCWDDFRYYLEQKQVMTGSFGEVLNSEF